MDSISYETFCLKEYFLSHESYMLVVMQIASDLMSNNSYDSSIESLTESIRDIVLSDMNESLKEASTLTKQLALSSIERIDFGFISKYIIDTLT